MRCTAQDGSCLLCVEMDPVWGTRGSIHLYKQVSHISYLRYIATSHGDRYLRPVYACVLSQQSTMRSATWTPYLMRLRSGFGASTLGSNCSSYFAGISRLMGKSASHSDEELSLRTHTVRSIKSDRIPCNHGVPRTEPRTFCCTGVMASGSKVQKST